jgi:hypothetical protein
MPLKEGREPVDNRNDRVSLGHGQRAAGTEVPLHVDHDERITWFDGHTTVLSDSG